MDDVILNKISSIHQCIHRIKQEYSAYKNEEALSFTHQDALILNLLRACETGIDLANYIVKKKKIGLPKSSGESFELLFEAGILMKL